MILRMCGPESERVEGPRRIEGVMLYEVILRKKATASWLALDCVHAHWDGHSDSNSSCSVEVLSRPSPHCVRRG